VSHLHSRRAYPFGIFMSPFCTSSSPVPSRLQYPVLRWRRMFEEVASQVAEVEAAARGAPAPAAPGASTDADRQMADTESERELRRARKHVRVHCSPPRTSRFLLSPLLPSLPTDGNSKSKCARRRQLSTAFVLSPDGHSFAAAPALVLPPCPVP